MSRHSLLAGVGLSVVVMALAAPSALAQDIKLKSSQGDPKAEPIAPRFKPSPEPKKALAVEQIGWLSGCWKARQGSGTNNIEQWTKSFGPLMLGLGAEMRGTQVVSYEYMRIEAKDNKLVYAVKQKDKAERSFTQMSEVPETLMFENPGSEFPQRVTYRKENETSMEIRVEGEVSGKMRASLFKMERVNCN